MLRRSGVFMTTEEIEATLNLVRPYLGDRRFRRGLDMQFGIPETKDFPILFEQDEPDSGWVIWQKPADLNRYAANSLMIGYWTPLKKVLDIVASLESGHPCLASIQMLDHILSIHCYVDKDIKLLLGKIDQDTLIKALVADVPEMKDAIISNTPQKYKNELIEKVSALQGKVSIAESYEACKTISETISQLFEEGQIGKQEQSPGASRDIQGASFSFEALQALDDCVIRGLTEIVQPETWAVALKGTSNELRSKIFSNMSQHTAEDIKKIMEEIGPIRLSELAIKQQAVLVIYEWLKR